MEKMYFKADIRANKKAIFLSASLMLIVTIIGLVPVKHGRYGEIYNLLGMVTYWQNSSGKWNTHDAFVVFIIPFIIFALLSILCWLYIKSSKYCTIELTDKAVNGVRKTIFSKHDLNLPIEQVDSIMISHSFWDTLFGSDTLLIRSASGLIKFPWVRNAKEFTDATLARIEAYKKKESEKNHNLVADSLNLLKNNNESQSTAQKIKELKELLEIGAISQEEFNAKRKELLDKM